MLHLMQQKQLLLTNSTSLGTAALIFNSKTRGTAAKVQNVSCDPNSGNCTLVAKP